MSESLRADTDRSKLPEMVGAVIYVRVSTKEQTENLSLATQLKACENYCERQGFQVLARFREEGESAKTADRTELQKLLQFCRTNKGAVQFVVVFNLTRFARDKYDHFALRAHLKSLGISLRSATEPIDDTSTGKLMEGVLAAFAQFDNDCRSDRTRAGMKAALELGRWVFLAPLGYLNAPRAIGKSLMPDPERAPNVCRVFEEYATGRFTKQQVLEQARAWGLTNRRNRPLTSQAIGMLLRNQLYAGIVDVPEYGVRAQRGDFEPLISEDLFYRVQSELSGRVPSTTPQQRAHPDFPLRAFVRCEFCGRGLTAAGRRGEAGLRLEVALREGAARAGLQVALEADRGGLVGELDDDVQLPRSMATGVRAVTAVVHSEACADIGGTPHVELRIREALENIHKALAARHEAPRRQSWYLSVAVGNSGANRAPEPDCSQDLQTRSCSEVKITAFLRVACRAEPADGSAARLRRFAATARHPSPVGHSLGLPSRSSPKASEGWWT
jgi:DNA invertase Pin-like site-specific DNA recombinase